MSTIICLDSDQPFTLLFPDWPYSLVRYFLNDVSFMGMDRTLTPSVKTRMVHRKWSIRIERIRLRSWIRFSFKRKRSTKLRRVTTLAWLKLLVSWLVEISYLQFLLLLVVCLFVWLVVFLLLFGCCFSFLVWIESTCCPKESAVILWHGLLSFVHG